MEKLFSFAALNFILLAFLSGVTGQQPEKVPLPDVLKNPSQFDGKVIEVRGFFVHQFENSGLYVSPDWQRTKAIWITPSTAMTAERDKLRNHFVILVGSFDAKSRGHLGGFEGTLTVAKFELAQDDAPSSPGKEGKK